MPRLWVWFLTIDSIVTILYGGTGFALWFFNHTWQLAAVTAGYLAWKFVTFRMLSRNRPILGPKYADLVDRLADFAEKERRAARWAPHEPTDASSGRIRMGTEL